MGYLLLVLLSLFVLSALFIYIDFFFFLITGKKKMHRFIILFSEIGALVILPFLYAGFGYDNVCCFTDEIDTPAFSLKHQLSVAVIILLCLAGYFYSKFRKTMAPPLLEVLVNTILVMGFVLNIIISFHTVNYMYALTGSIPILLLFIMMLGKNQQMFISQSVPADKKQVSRAEKIAWQLLAKKPVTKFPVLLLLCLPVLTLISSILLLFGQKPDSIIRAFTETYKHGFSQWDYKCEDVICDGHYLCSVAAKGHIQIVKPERYGTRNGCTIICNRQLLVSNAFEDLIKEKLPRVHKIVRRKYNKIGNLVHRYYALLNNKWVADIIYLFMKPLEWFFLGILYLADRKPENRIAKQYISTAHRQAIERQEALNCLTNK